MASPTPTRFVRGGQVGWAHDEGHAAGTFETYDHLDLGWLGPRKLHVFVPRAPAPASGFPLLVMHDGDTAFWPGGVAHATWDVAGRLSELRDDVGPVVVAALHPVERDREYTHADWAHGHRPYGGLPRYAAWLADTVVPWLREHYPLGDRPATVLGSSHGGLAAFWCATRHPETFGFAGCFSPSFFTGVDSLAHGAVRTSLAAVPLVREVEPLLSDPARRPRLWTCWGTRRDGGEHNGVVEALATLRGRELAELLVARHGYVLGRDLFVLEDVGAGHDEGAWRRRFGPFARVAFPAAGKL